jgi:hypothetical protein
MLTCGPQPSLNDAPTATEKTAECAGRISLPRTISAPAHPINRREIVTDFREEHTSIPKEGWLRLNVHRTDFGTYCTGEFLSRNGPVSVYQEEPGRTFKKGYTRLDAVIGGKLVYRTWDTKLGRRSIYREARTLLETNP